MKVSVFAEIGGMPIHVGTLYSHRGGRTESASFRYSPDFLARPDAFALEPGLPLFESNFQTAVGRSLFGAFGDSAPDSWGRRIMQRKESSEARTQRRARRNLGEIDFLLGVGDFLRQGALRFRIEEGPFLAEQSQGIPELIGLGALLRDFDEFEADSADVDVVNRLFNVGSSLGGARPKAHVRLANGRYGIAKFPSARNDGWNVMLWEAVALELARRCGIAVSNFDLLSISERNVLVVERFDRSPSGQRVGYVSAMTMLEETDGATGSYLQIAEVIETHSNQTTVDLRELWRRVVFSILISNTDDHLRNHGFLCAGRGSWNLSPAFDLNPNPYGDSLSTSVTMFENALDLSLAMEVAEPFRVPIGDAKRTIEDLRQVVSQWKEVAKRLGAGKSEIHIMETAFSLAN